MVGTKRVISKIQNRNIVLGLTYNCQKKAKVYQRVWRTRNVLTAALLSQTYNSLKNSSRKQGLKLRCEDSKTSKVIEPPKPKLLCAGCVLIGITRWSPVNELTEETVYVLYIWQRIMFLSFFCKETRPEKIRTSHYWIEIINWRFNLYELTLLHLHDSKITEPKKWLQFLAFSLIFYSTIRITAVMVTYLLALQTNYSITALNVLVMLTKDGSPFLPKCIRCVRL